MDKLLRSVVKAVPARRASPIGAGSLQNLSATGSVDLTVAFSLMAADTIAALPVSLEGEPAINGFLIRISEKLAHSRPRRFHARIMCVCSRIKTKRLALSRTQTTHFRTRATSALFARALFVDLPPKPELVIWECCACE